MRYALISDIHGNFPALEGVLEDAKRQGADRYIFLGDYIFDMPFSNEVCSLVAGISNAVAVSGNKEGYLDWLDREDRSGWTHEQMGAVYETFRELTDGSRQFISGLNQHEYIASEGGNIFVCHCPHDMTSELMSLYGCDGEVYEKMEREKYTRADFLNYYKDLCESDCMKSIAEKINADVIIAGHNHIQGHAYIEDTLFVNPGSCGIPLDMERGAAYTILEETDNGYKVFERRVQYDIDALIRQSRKTEIYKCAEIWCELLFYMLKTGIALHKRVFETAGGIAAKKGECGGLFSNETWREAYKIICKDIRIPVF